jgi:hypothetical protein
MVAVQPTANLAAGVFSQLMAARRGHDLISDGSLDSQFPDTAGAAYGVETGLPLQQNGKLIGPGRLHG